MKRIIALLMVVLMTFGLFMSTSVAALPSPTATTYYAVNVEIKGTGGVITSGWMVEADKGKTVTLQATEADNPFVFWNIIGSYNIIDGMSTDKVFTIEPLSDILAIATFEDGLDEIAIPANPDKSPTSPKTGQDALPVYIMLMLMVLVAVGIFYGVRTIKYKKAFDKI